MKRILYHGVNKIDDLKNGGKIYPKGSTTKVMAFYDGKIKHDGKYLLGPSTSNTARAAQSDNPPYDNSGISTSRSEYVAIHFATSGSTEDGFVYVIDETRLLEEGVTPVELPNPEFEKEREVTLVMKSKKHLPLSLIIEKYEVNSAGKRI